MSDERSPDTQTAAAFAGSWNRQRGGSVYTREQFLDWFTPLEPEAFSGKAVLELGFGNGSLLYHMAACQPARLSGVELGDTFERTKANLGEALASELDLHQADLTKIDLGPFDFVYCIGVLHHLKEPVEGFRAVLRHTRARGRFHCWVYAREGNAVIRYLVDPLRRVTSRLPWWLTKYAVALPAAAKYFLYAKLLRALAAVFGESVIRRLPLGAYSLWIAKRGFSFFHHVAFDQLVTPTTHYIDRATVESWLEDPAVDPDSRYVVFRNGNSWKFGGRTRS